MHCILVLDSGGTKCEALAFTMEGEILGWGYCDGSGVENRKYRGGPGRSLDAIREAAAQALDGVICDELSAAGSCRADITHSGKCVTSRFISEADAALALAGVDNGLVVLAGTGAFVFGRTPDGRELHLDGLGPLLGDSGSGYHIGRLALRMAAKASWHPRHATSLGRLVREQLIGDKARDDDGGCLIDFSLDDHNRSDIARLAKLVTEEAVKGDAVSLRILDEAAAALAETIRDVVMWLEMDGTEYAMAGTGSLVTRCPLYWDTICAKVQVFAPLLRPVISDLPAVVGYGVSALKTALPGNYEASVAALLRSARTTTRGESRNA